MTLAWYNTKPLRNIIGYWSFSQALYGIGSLLIVLRNIIPDFLSILVANLCLVAAQIAVQEGLARYMNREGYLRQFSFGIFASFALTMLFFTNIMPSVTARIIAYGLAVGLLAVISIKTLWPKEKGLDAPRMFLVVVLALTIVILIIRGVFALLEGDYLDLMHSSRVQAIGFIGLVFAYVSISNALFWLVMHKLGIEIQHQALTDALTGVGNRRALDELMEQQVPAAADSSVGIMMIDIDDFKTINDRFGHQAGDLYLIEFVRAVKQEGEYLFRYGGDEFVIVTYDIELAELMNKAEYVRQKVERLIIPWPDQGYIHTTASIGIAVTDGHTKNWDELAKQADQALYDVKNEGRNHVRTGGIPCREIK